MCYETFHLTIFQLSGPKATDCNCGGVRTLKFGTKECYKTCKGKNPKIINLEFYMSFLCNFM